MAVGFLLGLFGGVGYFLLDILSGGAILAGDTLYLSELLFADAVVLIGLGLAAWSVWEAIRPSEA